MRKVIIKTAKNKEPFVVLKAGNNETLFTTETYSSWRQAKKIADLLKEKMDAKLIDRTKKK